jgi:TusA-related sulfurtransferase
MWHPFCVKTTEAGKQRRSIQRLKRKADHILDFRGSITSMSLLKLIQTFREMNPNEVLELLGNNLDARSDLFKVLPDDAYELIFLDVVEEGGCFYRIQLKKIKIG